MITDIRTRPIGTRIETDICIIGGGAAGITLALALETRGIPCVLLESGGSAPDTGIQALYASEQSGLADAQSCRLRYFGGTTNHWGGYCTPLSPEDFEERAWVAHSGWPIGLPDLLPHYEHAQTVCGLAPFAYDCDRVGVHREQYRRFSADKVEPRFYQFSTPPRRFGEAYGEALKRSRGVEVYLYANVDMLEAGKNADTVRTAALRTLDGWTGEVRARQFVLACGGIENARLLLLSDRVQREGLGNAAGNVGRYFMQHPHVADTELLIGDPDALQTLFDSFARDGITYRASLGPCARAQHRHHILNCSATMHTPHEPDSGSAALSALTRDLKRGNWPARSGEKLGRVITDLDGVVDRLAYGPRSGFLWLRGEQAPNPESRIMLSDQRDALGQRRTRVQWRLSALDKRTLRVSAHLIAQELGRLGIARLRLPLWLVEDDDAWPDTLWGGCHHMGTTRMSRTPAAGVVDTDCRVHGVDNLYIAGSSVFPTSGYANPTLTIVALALRLADHLAAESRRRYPNSLHPPADARGRGAAGQASDARLRQADRRQRNLGDAAA
ncbi:MAG: GMC family oxidoreductase [Thiohalocapsa sp.]|nr:GMC family oxidoreductase [Thiohalocapsa sp.]